MSKNELLSAIDAKKNLLTLDEAKRHLAQLEQDIKSRTASGQATIAVSEAKRNKARVAMLQAQANIDKMTLRAPLDGLVAVKENADSTGGMFFSGMVLPEYREGDQVWPGRLVAQVVDVDEMEIQAKVDENDRANINPGQPVEVRIDALPGQTYTGKVKTVAGMASSNFWGGADSTKVRYQLSDSTRRTPAFARVSRLRSSFKGTRPKARSTSRLKPCLTKKGSRWFTSRTVYGLSRGK